MEHWSQGWIGTLLPLLVAGLVLLLRRKRMRRVTPLKVGRLWILPTFHLLLVLLIFWAHPPHGLLWLSVALGCLIGLPLGWYRGKLMRISVDPETHALSQQASPAAILFIVALVVMRQIGRSLALGDEAGSPEAVFAVTDVLLAFAFGFLVTQRLEMALRARALLARARAGAA